MPCIPFSHVAPDGSVVTGIACTRGARRSKCATCKQAAGLECDGCDRPLCAPCAVSHRTGVDFCPTCCRALFVEWCASAEGQRFTGGHRDLRRNAFRAWAKATQDRFDRLKKA